MRGKERNNINDDDDKLNFHFFMSYLCVYAMCVYLLGASDGSASDSSEREEQELWEETQIKKGVKRRPGGQV